MTKELTSEDMVTKLLLANDFVDTAKQNRYGSNLKNEGLGGFLSKLTDNNSSFSSHSKYSFIDETLDWGF